MLSSGYGSHMADFELVEPIGNAIAAELTAAGIYAALIKQAPDDEARALLETFIREENGHARSLAQAYATLTQMIWRNEARSADACDYTTALRQRLVEETGDFTRYAQYSRQASSPWLKKLFDRLSTEDAAHAMLLPLLMRQS